MATELTRHAQRKAETHQRLIDAAREEIAAQGYNAVEILDITERANVSKATFYKHFSNKEDCVRQLMQQGFDALVAEILDVEHTPPVTPAWVQASLERIFRWAEDNREFLLIMVGGGASSQLNAFGRSYMAEIVERTIASDFGEHAHDSGFPPAVKAQVITGIMIQLLGWWLENDTGHSAADMAHIVRQVLETGIAPNYD